MRAFGVVVALALVLAGTAGCSDTGSSTSGSVSASKSGVESSSAKGSAGRQGPGVAAVDPGAGTSGDDKDIAGGPANSIEGSGSDDSRSPASGRGDRTGGSVNASGSVGSSSGGSGEGSDQGGSGAPSFTPGDAPSGEALDTLVRSVSGTVTDVPMLHNFAVALGTHGTVPGSVIADQATELAKRFIAARDAAGRAQGSVAGTLGTALGDYAQLAGELRDAAKASRPLPDGFAQRLERVDTAWKAAIGALGTAAGKDLLADLPVLLMLGSDPPSVVPPPPDRP